MAIVNRTPDSFYDQARTFELNAALDAAGRAVDEGADIIDIGGVKAGPGEEVDEAAELARVIDAIAAVRQHWPDIVISIDTWRSVVAREAMAAGADLINDAWGGVDPDIARVAAETGASLVCTHAGGVQPRTRPHRIGYDDVVADVLATCTRLAEGALAAGVRKDGIVIDPGHDFGKNSRHSLEITRRTKELVATGWPVLVSVSRKDFVGETLDLPVGERLEGTLAATAICAWQGAQIFRAHDVRATRRVLDMVSAISGERDVTVARRGLA